MQFNVDLYTSDGEWIARPDGWLPEGVVWEIDSVAFHLLPAQYQATLARRNRLQRHGIRVVNHSPNQILEQPDIVIGDLRSAFDQACAGPPPAVVVRSRSAAA